VPGHKTTKPSQKKTVSLRDQGDAGFALIATILILSIVLAMAGVVISLILNNTQSVAGFSDYQREDNIASMGLEKAKNELQSDFDWADNTGTSSSSYLDGTLTLTLSNGSTDNITVTATGLYNNKKVGRTKTIIRSHTQAHNAQVDAGSTDFTANATVLNNVFLSNTGPANAQIRSIILSWSPATAPNTIAGIAIAGTNQWTATPTNTPHSAGSVLTFSTPYTLLAGASAIPITLTFDQNMSGKTISMVLQFDDGSTRSTTYVPGTTAASALSIDASNAKITGKKKKDIKDIWITNTNDTQSISIIQVQSTWIYNEPENQIKEIKLDNSKRWKGNANSGSTQVFSPAHTISAGASDKLELKFNDNIEYSQVELIFTMSDGSTRTSYVDFRIPQADFLTVDTAAANINGNKLRNMTLQNTHSDAKIWLDKLQISVSPNTSQTVEGISIDSSSKFGPSSDPDDLNIPLDITLTEIDTSVMTQDITFSTLSSSHDFTLTYIMRDGTSKTVSRNFASQGPASGSLSGSTANVTLTTGLDRVENFAVSRNGTAPVSFQHMKVSWNPVSTLKLEEIKIDGTRFFDSKSGVASGTDVTLTSPQSLTNSDSIVDFKFSKDIPNTDITIEFILSDGSRKSFTAFLNPGNSGVWAAGDNFEADQGVSGGSGFASNWIISDSDKETFKSGGSSYSGNQHMRLRESNTATRTLTNAATKTTQKATYTIRFGGYDNGEYVSFEKRIGGTGTWTTIRTIARPEFGTNTFYKFTDTLSMTIGQKCEIRFRSNANKNNEYVYIDELFFSK